MFQDIAAKRDEGLERKANMLQRQMRAAIGFPSPELLFSERKQNIVINQPKFDNSIHIDRSVVASVNSGTIHNLEVSMNHISNSNPELAQSLKAFTESVGNESSLNAEQIQEILEHLSVLIQEVERPKDKQRKVVLRTLLGAVKGGVQFASALNGAWSLVEHLIKAYTGL